MQIQKEIALKTGTATLPREYWDALDPILLSEGLFAAANIFSSLKLIYIFSVNPHLGPLQISLGRMVYDILKFFSVCLLVLFSFACGMNQLLWYIRLCLILLNYTTSHFIVKVLRRHGEAGLPSTTANI